MGEEREVKDDVQNVGCRDGIKFGVLVVGCWTGLESVSELQRKLGVLKLEVTLAA